MIFIGLELTGLSLYVMAAFDKEHRSSSEAGLKYFLFGSTGERLHALRAQLHLWHDGNDHARLDRPAPCRGANRTAARGRHRHDADWFRLQDRRRAISSLGARRLSGRTGSDRRIHRLGIEGRVLRRAGKNRAYRFWPGAWQRRLARDGRRLGADARSPRGTFDSHWQSRRARAKERAPTARLFRRRARRLHPARTGRRAGATVFRPRSSTRRFMGSRLSAPSASLHSSGARPVATISPILPGCARARRSLPVAWRSSCFRSPACRRSPDFSASSTFSVPRFALAHNHGLLWLVALALFGSLISLYYYLIVLKAIFVDESKRASFAFHPDYLQRVALTVLAGTVLFLGLMPETLLARILASVT